MQAVEQHGSLTAAAERLCVTQSALSHSVRKLEERLGTALWLRQGRSLRLTPAGQQVLILAQRVLPQLEQMETKLAQIAQGQRGSLRIGMECHPCYQWLLKVVAPYLAAWPDVEVDVKQKFQFGGLTALLDYEIDLLVTPDPVYQPGLVFTPVFDYEQVLVVSRHHPLAQADYARPTDLQHETLITYPSRPSGWTSSPSFCCRPVAPRRCIKALKPPTSCCKWWPVAGAWRPCRAGWCWNMPSAWPCGRCAWARRAWPSRFIWGCAAMSRALITWRPSSRWPKKIMK